MTAQNPVAALCGALFPLLLAGALPGQQSVLLPCTADNTLYEDPAGALSNGAGAGLFVGTTSNGSKRRAVVRFDVAGGVPAGARILAARLQLHVAQTSATVPQQAQVHRLLQAWGEGSSVATTGGGGSGAPATSGDATWLHTFFATSFWSQPGGDFAAVPSAPIELPTSGPAASIETTALAADVQAWLDHPGQNFGWLVRTDEALAGTARRLNSRESAGPRPELLLTYVLPGNAATWGTGCPTGFGTFTLAVAGQPVGGTTIQLQQSNAVPFQIGANFFALELDPAGFPLLPACLLHLGGGMIATGSLFVADGSGGAASPFPIPAGFTREILVSQSAALDATGADFVLSNAVVLCLQ